MSVASALPSPDTAVAARNGSFTGSGQRWGADGTSAASPVGAFAILFQAVSGDTVRPPAATDPAAGEMAEPGGQGGPAGSAGSGGPGALAGTGVAEASGEVSGKPSGGAMSSASVAAAGTVTGTGADAAPAASLAVPASGLDRQGASATGGGQSSVTPLEPPAATAGSALQPPGHGAASPPATASSGSALAEGVLSGTVPSPAETTAEAAPAPVATGAPAAPAPANVAPATAATAAATASATASATVPATSAVPTTAPVLQALPVPASAMPSTTVAASGTAPVPVPTGAPAPPMAGQPPRPVDTAAPAGPARRGASEVPDIGITDRRSTGVVAAASMVPARGDGVTSASVPGATTVAPTGSVTASPDPVALNGAVAGTTASPATAGQPGVPHPSVVSASAAAPAILLPGHLSAMSRAGATLTVSGSLEPPVPRGSGAAGAGSGGTMNVRLRTGMLNGVPFTVPQGPASGELPKALPPIASAEALARRAAIATDSALAARAEMPATVGAIPSGTQAPDGVPQAVVAAPGTAGITVSAPGVTSVGLSGTGTPATLSPGASTVSPPVPLTGADAPRDITDTIRLTLAQGRQVARIELTPVELGTMTVELEQRQDGRLSVALHSPVNATRDLVESMIPRLREQLANDGFTSVSVGVGDRGEEGERRGARHGLPTGADPDRNAGDSRGNGGERPGSERTGGERAGGEQAAGQRPDAERDRDGERGKAEGHSGTTDASPLSRTRSSGSLAAGSNRVLDAWI